jgi:phosphatidylethanolamine/phosphatidyl-N-methylethanolamine N-methyltransferase
VTPDSRENPLDREQLQKVYARWAPVYDIFFNPFCAPGRSAGVQAAERLGGRILEVGVGTGLSLPEYSRQVRLVGVDISEPMLRKAKERVAIQGLSNVDLLAVMDGTLLGFEDASFDMVAALFVITAVPDPEATLDELARVLRPGGEMVVVAHVSAETEPLRTLERGFALLAHRLGWRPDFPYRRLSDWATSAGLPLLERRHVRPLNLFSLLRYAKPAA